MLVFYAQKSDINNNNNHYHNNHINNNNKTTNNCCPPVHVRNFPVRKVSGLNLIHLILKIIL